MPNSSRSDIEPFDVMDCLNDLRARTTDGQGKHGRTGPITNETAIPHIVGPANMWLCQLQHVA